jgi:hypothetical protein
LWFGFGYLIYYYYIWIFNSSKPQNLKTSKPQNIMKHFWATISCIQIKFGFLFIIINTFVYQSHLHSQCLGEYSEGSQSSSEDCSRFFDEDMAFLYTEGIVYLNFHFIRNSNGGGNFGPSGDNNNLPNDDNLTGMQVVNDI